MFLEDNISKPRKPRRIPPSATKLKKERSQGIFNPEATLDNSRVTNDVTPVQLRPPTGYVTNPLVPNAQTRWTNAAMGPTNGTPSFWDGQIVPSVLQDMAPLSSRNRPKLDTEVFGATSSLSKQLEKLITNTPERESFLKLLDVLRKSGN